MMKIKPFRTFATLSLSVVFCSLIPLFTVSAQTNPCKEDASYSFGCSFGCDGPNWESAEEKEKNREKFLACVSECEASRKREEEEAAAKCRRSKNGSSDTPKTPIPRSTNNSNNAENKLRADAEARERARLEEERARLEEERARERTRAFNEQKKCPDGKTCAGRAEISDSDTNVDERTRAFNEQKKKQQAAKLVGNDRWIVEPNMEKGLIPGKNGQWLEGEFRVTCWGSDRLWMETGYLTAFVANSRGLSSCTGAGIEVSNASSKYPAYVGIYVINQEVKPRQREPLSLAHYRSRKDKRMTVAYMRVKWWKPYPRDR
jgi:hypothetical protein